MQARAMKVSDLYLVLYNLLSCAGWAYLLYLTVTSYFQLNLKPSQFWNQIGSKPFSVGPISFGGYGALHVIQSAAVLEVLHVAAGLVPSSLFANIMQVRAARRSVTRFIAFDHRHLAGRLPPHSGVGSHAPVKSFSGAFLSVRDMSASCVEKVYHVACRYLMVGSWALVEVPRYLYLGVNTVCKGTVGQPPAVLHVLRYNLFMLLYPTGITGEYLQARPSA
jgi:very-long-chain (3R)-3-hydroxyacyl-CoA dehydratase